MARKRTWKILDYGTVPQTARTIPYGGPCDHEAELPVLGTVIAEAGGGLVFDPGPHALPATIQCRQCKRVYTTAPEEAIA